MNSLRLDDLKVYDMDYQDVSALIGPTYEEVSQEGGPPYTVTSNNEKTA